MPKKIKELTTPALSVPAARLNGVYQVKEVIGEGTFSKVLRCFDSKNYREVAIKILKATHEDHLVSARTETEVLKCANTRQNSAREDERFIVALHGHFDRDIAPYLVLEYLPYRLREVLEKKILTERDTVTVGYSLLRALEVLSKACKTAQIVHGDLKPENIMLHRNGQVKVIDFGSSFFENKQLYKFCQTREYRAPEVILCETFDSAIDIWSVACIMAECCTAQKLFRSQLDYCHLYIITEYLGMPPDSLIEVGERRFDYFQKSETGQWEFKPMQKRLGRTVVPGSKPFLQDLQSDQTNSHKSLILDLIKLMLNYDPKKRIRPNKALDHPVFENCTSQELKIDMRMVDSQYLLTKQ